MALPLMTGEVFGKGLLRPMEAVLRGWGCGHIDSQKDPKRAILSSLEFSMTAWVKPHCYNSDGACLRKIKPH